MPSITQANAEIHDVWYAIWSVNFPTNPVAYENLPFNPPDGAVPWFRFTVKHAHGFQPTLADAYSNRKIRRVGTVWVNVFTPNGLGSDNTGLFMDIIKTAFECRSTPSGVIFREPSVRDGRQDGLWWMTPFTVKFEYDDVVPATLSP